jgi:hypothetical protein
MHNTTGILSQFQTILQNPVNLMPSSKKAIKQTSGLAMSQKTWDNLEIISLHLNRSRNNLIETLCLEFIEKFKAENPEIAEKLLKT